MKTRQEFRHGQAGAKRSDSFACAGDGRHKQRAAAIVEQMARAARLAKFGRLRKSELRECAANDEKKRCRPQQASRERAKKAKRRPPLKRSDTMDAGLENSGEWGHTTQARRCPLAVDPNETLFGVEHFPATTVLERT